MKPQGLGNIRQPENVHLKPERHTAAEHLVHPGDEQVGDGVLEPLGLRVDLAPVDAQDLHQEELDQPVSPQDVRRQLATGGGEEREQREEGAPLPGEEDEDDEPTVRIDLMLDAHLPDDYVPGGEARLEAYRRLAATRTPAEIDDVEEEWRDRFGELPEPAAFVEGVNRLLVGGD